MSEKTKTLLSSLFDLSFTSFITPRLIKIFFVLSILFAAFNSITTGIMAYKIIAMSMYSWGEGARAFAGLLAFVITTPVVFIVIVLLARLWLEVVMVLFRLVDLCKEIADNTKKCGPSES